MEIDARVVTANPENLPELLYGCDAVVGCLDSIPKKKMLEEDACTRGIPLVHGSVFGNEGFVFLAEAGEKPPCRPVSLHPPGQRACGGAEHPYDSCFRHGLPHGLPACKAFAKARGTFSAPAP